MIVPATTPPRPLSSRVLLPEQMDDPALDPARHAQALRGLQRLNRLAASVRIVWPAIRALGRSQRSVRVLDVATGAGDLPLALWRWARREPFALTIDGCDRSPTALAFAEANARRLDAPMRWLHLDALTDELPAGYDVVMCSLFLHHLSDAETTRLLTRMRRAARRMVLAHDLRRSPMGWLAAAGASRLVSRSPVVHYDAPQSVRAAYTRADLARLAERAGLDGCTIVRRWPWRLLLAWRA